MERLSLRLVNLSTSECYITDVERWRNLPYEKLRANVIAHLMRNNPDLTVIEANDATGGRILGDLCRTTRFPMRGVKPKGSKVERALQVIGLTEGRKVHLPARAAWLDAFATELAAFGPGARFSDQIDAMVWALLASKQYVAARREDYLFEQQVAGLDGWMGR